MLKINITIRRVNILSLAKMLTVLYFALGLVVSILLLVTRTLDANPAIFVASIVIGTPLFYAVLGFLSGLITGFAYNLFAGWLGGIELEALSEGMQYGGD